MVTLALDDANSAGDNLVLELTDNLGCEAKNVDLVMSNLVSERARRLVYFWTDAALVQYTLAFAFVRIACLEPNNATLAEDDLTLWSKT